MKKENKTTITKIIYFVLNISFVTSSTECYDEIVD